MADIRDFDFFLGNDITQITADQTEIEMRNRVVRKILRHFRQSFLLHSNQLLGNKLLDFFGYFCTAITYILVMGLFLVLCSTPRRNKLVHVHICDHIHDFEVEEDDLIQLATALHLGAVVDGS